MKRKCFLVLILIIFSFFIFDHFVLAETKEYSSDAPGRTIPKLPKTANDPVLIDGNVYPFWGPVCQRYTYSVIYQDKEGRPPEYVQIYFNGKMIDLQKENPEDNDYKKGVRYQYKYVPNKIGANFYYFEASNGLGKARASIIDSPDNGPVLFESAFENNEIGLIDTQTQEKILSYPTNKDWVEQVAMADNGQYFVAKTTNKVLFFETANSQKPVWEYQLETPGQTGDMVGGVAISSNGSIIAASTSNKILVFGKDSNRPKWEGEKGNQGLNIALSPNGQYLAAVVSTPTPDTTNGTTVVFWKTDNKTPLWQYFQGANFHDLDFSADGSVLVATTGCPDRRAYFFSKDSNEPLIRSEMLTYDSPVQRARITSDGQFAAFTTDGGPESSLVAFFNKDSKEPLWKYDDGQRRAARSLGMTPDGQFIAVGNMKGDLYLFSKENNTPLKKWQFKSSFGALDISDNGQLIAAGGTDKNVYLIEKDGNEPKPITFNEFVDTLDMSGDGKYVVVGTGASPYFFEDLQGPNKDKIYPCETVIEPKPREKAQNQGIIMNNGIQNDQGESGKIKGMKLPGMLAGFGFIGSTLALGIYFLIIKLKKFQKNKTVIIILASLSGICLIVSTSFAIFNKMEAKKVQNQPQTENSQQQQEVKDPGVCGNSICEPDLGESKQSCPKDCSAE